MGRSKARLALMVRLWPLGRVMDRLAQWPLLATLLRPWYSPAGNEAIIIPVQEAVRGTESVVLPLPLLAPLIEQASARVILDECLCRRAEDCQAHPHGPGCLFLGDGAAQIDPELGRPATVAEVLAHAQQAMGRGLTPLVVHSSFDAWMLDIPYHRMLAVCFCCDCCCTVRQGLRHGPRAFWDTVVRLPGLAVAVGAGCSGCGQCVAVCPVGAVSVQGGVARIAEVCKGCGRCAAICPESALRLQLDTEGDVLERLLARIKRRTDIGSRSTLE